MGFQRPPLSDLQNLADQLSKEYKGTNPQRLSFIALLKETSQSTAQLNTEKNIDILLGAIVFELGTIESEFSMFGSQMHSIIKKKINLNDQNPMSVDERLIYLHRFHQYSENSITEDNVKHITESVHNCEWKNKEELLKKVHAELKRARTKDTNYINALVNGTPNLIAIQKKMQTVTRSYHAKRASRWSFMQSSKRGSACDINDFIHDTCLDFFATNYTGNTTLDKKTEQLQELECKTRLGLNLAMLMDIDNEYWVLSPKGGWFNRGSELYKLLLPIMNIKDVDNISYDDKNDWLCALRNHLANVKKDEAYYQSMVKKYKALNVENIEELFKQFEARVNKLYSTLQDQKNISSRKVRMATTITSYFTQTIAATVLAGAAANAMKYALTGAGSVVGGPIVGFAVYMGTTVIMTGLRAMIGRKILTSGAAMLYGWVLEKIGDTVANAAVGMVAYPFTISTEGLTSLRHKLSAENDKLFCDWVNTLLEMPIDIVPVKEKEQIRDVLGLEVEEKLMPLPIKVDEKREEQLHREGFFSKVLRARETIEDYQPKMKAMKN